MESPSPNIRDILTEKFHALLDECDLVAHNASFGKTLDDLETFFLLQGRTFLREVFQEKLQERIEQTELNDSSQCGDCKKKTTIKDKKSKTIVSAHGAIRISRRYHHCFLCKKYSFPVEVTLGLTESYTTGLKRMVARCVGLGSYQLAQDNLAELCQIYLSPTTLGDIADATAGKIAKQMENNDAFRRVFQQAKGETEFYSDGTFVHIRNADGTTEWREFKLGAYAKRVRGAFAFPHEWHTRTLPKPTVVSAFAAIVGKDGFQELCHKMRHSLGVGGVTSALGDGAKWIWNVNQAVHGKTEECLDIYHGAEHISDCGKVLFGVPQDSKDWFERMRLVLVSEGFSGMERELGSLLGSLKSTGKKQKSHREAIESLQNYLRGNVDRLNYCERLSKGRAIGSGLIEGACKNLVGKRMKQTGACWRLERANRIAGLCATIYSHQWNIAWKATH
jgi:hypothetical protein